MALCVVVGAKGVLEATATSPTACTSYVLMDASEWPSSSLWAMPTAEELSAAWMAGFVIPVFVFIVAAACRQLIKMFD